MLAVKAQDGTVIPGPVQVVRLPTAGSTVQIVGASGDTTLSKSQPTTSEQQLAGQPWLGAGDDSSTYGVMRAVVVHPPLAAAWIPADATETGAQLKVWRWSNDCPALRLT